MMPASFREMIAQFEEIGAETIASFVEQWIGTHLFGEDMELARFIQQNQKIKLGSPGASPDRRQRTRL